MSLTENFEKVCVLVKKLDTLFGIKTQVTLSSDDSKFHGGVDKGQPKIWMSESYLRALSSESQYHEYAQVYQTWIKNGYRNWIKESKKYSGNTFYMSQDIRGDEALYCFVIHEYAHVLDKGLHGHGPEYCVLLSKCIRTVPYSPDVFVQKQDTSLPRWMR